MSEQLAGVRFGPAGATAEPVRTALIAILERQEGIAVVGSAADGVEALQVAEALTPDVILMDVRMPVMDGVQATVELRRRWPEIKVLMLTTFDDDAYIVEALRAEAAGYMKLFARLQAYRR